jgi:multiple sugar transport system substrate-binding protein
MSKSGMRPRVLVPVATAASLSLLLTACSDDSGSEASAATKGNVTLEFWSWTDGIEAQTEVWNKKHPETQIKFVNAAGDTAYQKLGPGRPRCWCTAGAGTAGSGPRTPRRWPTVSA